MPADSNDLPDLPESGPKPDAEAFGRALGPGIGINLLVADVARAARWQMAVLGAEIRYRDEDFAILTALGSVWMLHHDRTYRRHPMEGLVAEAGFPRGAGAELRLYGRDPDAAGRVAARFEAAGAGAVLAGAADKPHGLRESFLLDPDGYVWVPGVPKAGG